MSKIVPEIITGSRVPVSSKNASMANRQAFMHQRVERGLRQQQVDSALHQRPDLRLVVRHHLVESHIAPAGIFDVNPHRELLLGRADAAGDEPGLVRILAGELVSDVPGQLGGCSVQLVNVVLKTELLERQRRAVERVGLDDVGTRLEVSAVNLLDQPWLRQPRAPRCSSSDRRSAGRTGCRGHPPRSACTYRSMHPSTHRGS